jgi:hypothetical protein
MDFITIILIAAGVFIVLFILVAAFLIIRKFRKGGNVMKPSKKQMREVEELEEPNADEIETVDEGENEEPEAEQPKEQQKAFCMVVVEGGKAYRGEFLGEEPQLVTLGNNQLVKVDSYWLLLKTEKVPLLKINRNHIIMVAFENLPQAPTQQKQVQKKSKEAVEAEEAIESIDV